MDLDKVTFYLMKTEKMFGNVWQIFIFPPESCRLGKKGSITKNNAKNSMGTAMEREKSKAFRWVSQQSLVPSSGGQPSAGKLCCRAAGRDPAGTDRE